MGKASRRKKEKREQQETTSRPEHPTRSIVENLLFGTANPLVMICVYGPEDPIKGRQFFRSMGFVCERLKDNLKLVVTCRHSLLELKKYQQGCVVMKNPNVNVLKVMGEPIEDTNPETDIAFMVVEDPFNSPTQPFMLSEENPPLVVKDQMLYNASAKDVNPFMRSFNPFIARQQVGEEHRAAYCKMSETATNWMPFTNVELQQKLEGEGWIRCRMFNMVSRKGFSGSPIWDDELRLYGLDVRGSSPGDGFFEELGDQVVCLPTSELYKARQRIQPLLTEFLTKT